MSILKWLWVVLGGALGHPAPSGNPENPQSLGAWALESTTGSYTGWPWGCGEDGVGVSGWPIDWERIARNERFGP